LIGQFNLQVRGGLFAIGFPGLKEKALGGQVGKDNGALGEGPGWKKKEERRRDNFTGEQKGPPKLRN
jgi:hypothetical protein